ncbi:MAG: flavin reductase family protein [Thermodesulfobacteriota bacterium]
MSKKDIADQVFAFVPITTQTILGTSVKGRPNFMALAWLTRVNFKPPMIAIAVNKNNQSCGGILETGQFSVNVPSKDMAAITDYTGLVSARNTDKSGLFEVFHGRLEKAPLIRECPLNVECRVVEKVELPTNFLFVGEVAGVHAEERFLTDGLPDYDKIRPFLLTMPDNLFRALGEQVGRAWHDGKALKKA